MLGMFCVRACSGLLGMRMAPPLRSLHSLRGITVAQVGLWCWVCVQVLVEMSLLKLLLCIRDSTTSVSLCAADWRGGSQASGTEGSVRWWWQTSVCPQDSKGRCIVLLYLNRKSHMKQHTVIVKAPVVFINCSYFPIIYSIWPKGEYNPVQDIQKFLC